MNHFQQAILNDLTILQHQFDNLRGRLQHWGETGSTGGGSTSRSRGGARGLRQGANPSHQGTTRTTQSRSRSRSRARNRATTVGTAGVANR